MAGTSLRAGFVTIPFLFGLLQKENIKSERGNTKAVVLGLKFSSPNTLLCYAGVPQQRNGLSKKNDNKKVESLTE